MKNIFCGFQDFGLARTRQTFIAKVSIIRFTAGSSSLRTYTFERPSRLSMLIPVENLSEATLIFKRLQNSVEAIEARVLIPQNLR